MDMQNNSQENRDFEKVAELLTPKHPRKCKFTFTTPPKKHITSKIWTISGVAAMFAIVITIAIKSVMPISAAEVINSAITALTDAKSVKVEFAWRGVKGTSEEIYTPDPLGNMVDGTLYILRNNGTVKTRIDWHDAEKNSIVFNGRDYIHLRNNKIINRHSSSFGEQLMNLFSQNSLPEVITDKSIMSTDGDIIIIESHIESHKGEITFLGEFNKDSKRLTKASISISLPNRNNLKILETKSIETDRSIPESIFIE